MSAADAAIAQAAGLYSAGRLGEAQALCATVLRDDPRHFMALHLASAIALAGGELEACERLSAQALAVEPRNAEVLANRGAALRRLNRVDEALAIYAALLAQRPSAPVLVSQGIALAAANRHREAIASYDAALALKPDATARFHRALSRLVLGDMPGAWDDFEARWGGAQTQGPARAFPVPRWNGREEIGGRTVLLHAEQGLGDTIQFSRYAIALARRGARVVLEVHPPLAALLSSLGHGIDVVAMGDSLPAFDFHVPLLSMPLAFATALESIPDGVPYLAAPAGHVAKWQRLLADVPRPRVGIAWSGSPTLANDRNRSIALHQWQPLAESGVSLVSLQKEVRDADRAALAAIAGLRHFGGELADFRDTAALVSQLDGVIAVDTAVAHLAGAMGKPARILLPYSPDWRWLLERTDSPWYPTVRLLRQRRIGDWAPVMEAAAREAPTLATGAAR